MKKFLLIITGLIVAFTVLLPFTSKTPDGLQTLADNSAAQQKPVWDGLIADYSVAIADPYVSTLVAGVLGTGIVLSASFVLGVSVARKKKTQTSEEI